MTKYLKDTDRVRSLVRGIEADLKYMETSTEKTFARVRSRIKKSLDELSTEITNLYSYLDDSTMYSLLRSELERDKRQSTIEEFEAAQRSYESKLAILESNPPNKDTEDFADSAAIDSLIHSHKQIRLHSFDAESKTSELISEIDSEMPSHSMLDIAKSHISELTEVQLFALVAFLLILLIWFISS